MERSQDGAYKVLFSQPRLVEDLLRGFVREPWVERLDFTTLEKINPAFVSDDLRHREDDLVWRLRQGGKRWLYVYLILEFQSEVDPYMAVRILTYVGLLYQDLIRRRDLAPGGRLPPVLPLVLYNGRREWRAALEVSDLIARVPGGLGHSRPRLRYRLIEEQALESTEIAPGPNLASALFELERGRTLEEVQRVLARLLRWLPEPEQRELRRAFAIWLRRVLLPARMPGAVLPEVDDLEECKTMLEETVLDWTRQAKEMGLEEGRQEGLREGRQEGIREGRREGLEEGRQKGEARMLLRQLAARFGELPPQARARVEGADSEQLLAWGERLVRARRLEDVFAS